MDFFFFVQRCHFATVAPESTALFFCQNAKHASVVCEFKNCETDFYAEQNSERSSSCLMALSTVTLGQYISL